LRKLYARRDGVEPARVPLTRGALARLYVNGELYTEAVAELYALLAQEPDRVDLQALLAEALWRSDQRVDAADTALRVLDRLPYCLDANLILGEIWTSGGREEDADVHLKRAQALDPGDRKHSL
jgi:predicted Zn-dependent protease